MASILLDSKLLLDKLTVVLSNGQ